MNEMEELLNRIEELHPELPGQLKEAIDERSKDGPVKILVVGGNDAEIMRAVMKRLGTEERVQIVEQPERIRVDPQAMIASLDGMLKELIAIRDRDHTVHDMVIAEAEVVEQIRPRKAKVKGFQSNRQFKQQNPGFKNQHQMRAMIRPPRRGG